LIAFDDIIVGGGSAGGVLLSGGETMVTLGAQKGWKGRMQQRVPVVLCAPD
jgi:hypothetical protein